MFGIDITGIEGAHIGTPRELTGGHHQVVYFSNGYEASVAQHDYSYGLELAVRRDGVVVYDTPVTDDVIGHLNTDRLNQLIRDISELKAPVRLTYWEVRKLAGEVVEEFGRGHTVGTEGCTYVTCFAEEADEDGTFSAGPLRPVCLVGQILVKAGVDMELLDGFASFNHERDHFKDYRVTFTDKAYYFLDALQAVQDAGEEWGLALDLASKMTGRRTWDGDQNLIKI